MNSSATASDAIVHLHATRTRLLHINGRVLTRSLRRLAHRIHFTHLNHGAFRISLRMQWPMSTARHAMVFQIWICLRSIVLIILLRP